MLGYAIEASFKAALNEIRDSLSNAGKKLLYKHHLPDLWKLCKKHGLFDDVEVSAEFLEYASDLLDQRYPSQQAKVLKNRQYLPVDRNKIWTYDDFLLRLDDSLWKSTDDSEVSIGVSASTRLFPEGRSTAWQFFHANPFAIERARRYAEPLHRNRHAYVEAIETLENDPNSLFHSDLIGPYILSPEQGEQIAALELAKQFRYPKKDVPDPDETRWVLPRRGKQPSRTDLYQIEWAIKRLTEALGERNIWIEYEEMDMSRATTTPVIVAWVFDRTVDPWCTAIILKEGMFQWYRNEGNQAKLEALIASIRSQLDP